MLLGHALQRVRQLHPVEDQPVEGPAQPAADRPRRQAVHLAPGVDHRLAHPRQLAVEGRHHRSGRSPCPDLAVILQRRNQPCSISVPGLPVHRCGPPFSAGLSGSAAASSASRARVRGGALPGSTPSIIRSSAGVSRQNSPPASSPRPAARPGSARPAAAACAAPTGPPRNSAASRSSMPPCQPPPRRPAPAPPSRRGWKTAPAQSVRPAPPCFRRPARLQFGQRAQRQLGDMGLPSSQTSTSPAQRIGHQSATKVMTPALAMEIS
jgi:hypothetical protein